MKPTAPTITNDLEAMDLNRVCRFIQESYWGKGRSKARIFRSFETSICFAPLIGGTQAGFARVVSDEVFHAYISDLFVYENFRGLGLAKALIEAILNHERLRDVSSFMLATHDAHGLYEPFGFRPADPNRYMVRQVLEG